MNGTVDGNAIICGALFGLCATIVGWVKNGGKLSGFQAKGLVLKMPIGVVVGMIAAYKGIGLESAEAWAGAIGLVTVIDGVVKAIIRRFDPTWLSLEDAPAEAPKPPIVPPAALLFLLVASLPLVGGCFQSPPAVLSGHDAAALYVQRSAANYSATVDGLAQALRAERKAHVEYAVQKAMDNVRLEAAKDGGKIDAEKALKYVQEAYSSRDKQVAEMEVLIRKYRQAAQAGEREALFALELMGELKKYDAAGVDPVKTMSEASSIFVPVLKAPELEGK